MAKHNELGKKGEEIAAQYLSEKGYEILERNWRNRHKEIDIIAKDGNELVIVEVKTRQNDEHGEPDLAVTLPKQTRLIYAANAYMDARARAGVDLGERDCWGPKCWSDIFGRKAAE